MRGLTYLHGTIIGTSLDGSKVIRFCPPLRARYGGSTRCALYRKEGNRLVHIRTFAKIETAFAAL